MENRSFLQKIDFEKSTVQIGDKTYPLTDSYFPTVNPENPAELSEGERHLMNILQNSFTHSEKLCRHVRFLLSKGAMYKICNSNLMFHGCIPMTEKGEFDSFSIGGRELKGKALLDEINNLVNSAYFEQDKEGKDLLWYLWCGEKSPLYGKDKLALFEQYFIDDKELCKEHFNSYYKFSREKKVCEEILEHFGIDSKTGHIINGHVPVKIKEGESPVKAEGKLYLIDGGISKAYQQATGIAGYTLIYDSHSLSLAEHKPYDKEKGGETPKIQIVEKLPRRYDVSDTDNGKELQTQIDDLKLLLGAYRRGEIKERE